MKEKVKREGQIKVERKRKRKRMKEREKLGSGMKGEEEGGRGL